MTDIPSRGVPYSRPASGKQGNFGSFDFLAFLVFALVFYASAYFSVSDNIPTSIPVHHDDYTNYAAGGAWNGSWIRPLSTYIIHLLAKLGPDWLIWTIRLLTVTFVFLIWKLLSRILEPTFRLPTLILFSIAVFSTPIIVWYGRYTGMITHLLSGCLGVSAVLMLFREISQPHRGYMALSFVLLLASVLAKEDFVSLYAVSLAYAAILSREDRTRIVSWGIAGLVVCFLLIAGEKFMAASPFVGTVDTSAPYYVDPSLGGMLRTFLRYVLGNGDPAMAPHGRVVAGLFGFSTATVVALFGLRKQLPKSGYFLAATLSVMAPYCLLPNHVSTYYELIWLPLLVACAYVAMTELTHELVSARLRVVVPITALALFAVTASTLDYPGRKAIAAWYDSIASANRRIISVLQSKASEINHTSDVCVWGAAGFSPWFMHDGRYLDNVLGLHTRWHIILDETSPAFTGMQVGANSSQGRTVLVTHPDQLPASCLSVVISEPRK